jgi:hypothetical protein
MNNMVALEPNNLIENIPEENFARKAFNRVVNVVTTPLVLYVCSITVSTIGAGMLVQDYRNKSSNSTIDITGTALYIGGMIPGLVLMTVRNVMIEYSHLQEDKRDTVKILPYNQLQQLPSDYKYNKDDVCPISYEKLEKGDTVCCDKHLYSYLSLKESYIKCSKLIPHSLNPIKWNENIYKLPEYSSK